MPNLSKEPTKKLVKTSISLGGGLHSFVPCTSFVVIFLAQVESLSHLDYGFPSIFHDHHLKEHPFEFYDIDRRIYPVITRTEWRRPS